MSEKLNRIIFLTYSSLVNLFFLRRKLSKKCSTTSMRYFVWRYFTISHTDTVARLENCRTIQLWLENFSILDSRNQYAIWNWILFELFKAKHKYWHPTQSFRVLNCFDFESFRFLKATFQPTLYPWVFSYGYWKLDRYKIYFPITDLKVHIH